MNRSKLLVVLHLILYSISNLGVPLVAMVVLQPAQYGVFSLVYLVGALASTMQLSVVSEVWVRAQGRHGAANTWNRFINATVLIGVFGGTVGILVALLFEDTRPYWPLLFVAVFAQVYASGSSFRALRGFDWRYVLPTDVLGTLAVVGSAVALVLFSDGALVHVLVAWAAVKTASMLGARPPERLDPREAVSWIRTNRKDITTLVSDGAIANVANIGTPYMLTPALGLANLGTYRALENLSGPVRTVIASARPVLTRLPTRRLGSATFALLVVALSSAVGACASGALMLLERTDLDFGTLNSLYPFTVVVGLHLSVITVWTLYPLLARQVAPSRQVVTVRAAVSVLAIVAPLVGAAVWGLPGALWAQVGQLSVAAFVWWRVVNWCTARS